MAVLRRIIIIPTIVPLICLTSGSQHNHPSCYNTYYSDGPPGSKVRHHSAPPRCLSHHAGDQDFLDAAQVGIQESLPPWNRDAWLIDRYGLSDHRSEWLGFDVAPTDTRLDVGMETESDDEQTWLRTAPQGNTGVFPEHAFSETVRDTRRPQSIETEPQSNGLTSQKTTTLYNNTSNFENLLAPRPNFRPQDVGLSPDTEFQIFTQEQVANGLVPAGAKLYMVPIDAATGTILRDEVSEVETPSTLATPSFSGGGQAMKMFKEIGCADDGASHKSESRCSNSEAEPQAEPPTSLESCKDADVLGKSECEQVHESLSLAESNSNSSGTVMPRQKPEDVEGVQDDEPKPIKIGKRARQRLARAQREQEETAERQRRELEEAAVAQALVEAARIEKEEEMLAEKKLREEEKRRISEERFWVKQEAHKAKRKPHVISGSASVFSHQHLEDGTHSSDESALSGEDSLAGRIDEPLVGSFSSSIAPTGLVTGQTRSSDCSPVQTATVRAKHIAKGTSAIPEVTNGASSGSTNTLSSCRPSVIDEPGGTQHSNFERKKRSKHRNAQHSAKEVDPSAEVLHPARLSPSQIAQTPVDESGLCKSPAPPDESELPSTSEVSREAPQVNKLKPKKQDMEVVHTMQRQDETKSPSEKESQKVAANEASSSKSRRRKKTVEVPFTATEPFNFKFNPREYSLSGWEKNLEQLWSIFVEVDVILQDSAKQLTHASIVPETLLGCSTQDLAPIGSTSRGESYLRLNLDVGGCRRKSGKQASCKMPERSGALLLDAKIETATPHFLEKHPDMAKTMNMIRYYWTLTFAESVQLRWGTRTGRVMTASLQTGKNFNGLLENLEQMEKHLRTAKVQLFSQLVLNKADADMEEHAHSCKSATDGERDARENISADGAQSDEHNPMTSTVENEGSGDLDSFQAGKDTTIKIPETVDTVGSISNPLNQSSNQIESYRTDLLDPVALPTELSSRPDSPDNQKKIVHDHCEIDSAEPQAVNAEVDAVAFRPQRLDDSAVKLPTAAGEPSPAKIPTGSRFAGPVAREATPLEIAAAERHQKQHEKDLSERLKQLTISSSQAANLELKDQSQDDAPVRILLDPLIDTARKLAKDVRERITKWNDDSVELLIQDDVCTWMYHGIVQDSKSFSDAIKVTVWSPAATSIEMTLPRSSTIADIKSEVQSREGIDPREQRMLLELRPDFLRNEQRLSSLTRANNVFIQLVIDADGQSEQAAIQYRQKCTHQVKSLALKVTDAIKRGLDKRLDPGTSPNKRIAGAIPHPMMVRDVLASELGFDQLGEFDEESRKVLMQKASQVISNLLKARREERYRNYLDKVFRYIMDRKKMPSDNELRILRMQLVTLASDQMKQYVDKFLSTEVEDNESKETQSFFSLAQQWRRHINVWQRLFQFFPIETLLLSNWPAILQQFINIRQYTSVFDAEDNRVKNTTPDDIASIAPEYLFLPADKRRIFRDAVGIIIAEATTSDPGFEQSLQAKDRLDKALDGFCSGTEPSHHDSLAHILLPQSTRDLLRSTYDGLRELQQLWTYVFDDWGRRIIDAALKDHLRNSVLHHIVGSYTMEEFLHSPEERNYGEGGLRFYAFTPAPSLLFAPNVYRTQIPPEWYLTKQHFQNHIGDIEIDNSDRVNDYTNHFFMEPNPDEEIFYGFEERVKRNLAKAGLGCRRDLYELTAGTNGFLMLFRKSVVENEGVTDETIQKLPSYQQFGSVIAKSPQLLILPFIAKHAMFFFQLELWDNKPTDTSVSASQARFDDQTSATTLMSPFQPTFWNRENILQSSLSNSLFFNDDAESVTELARRVTTDQSSLQSSVHNEALEVSLRLANELVQEIFSKSWKSPEPVPPIPRIGFRELAAIQKYVKSIGKKNLVHSVGVQGANLATRLFALVKALPYQSPQGPSMLQPFWSYDEWLYRNQPYHIGYKPGYTESELLFPANGEQRTDAQALTDLYRRMVSGVSEFAPVVYEASHFMYPMRVQSMTDLSTELLSLPPSQYLQTARKLWQQKSPTWILAVRNALQIQGIASRYTDISLPNLEDQPFPFTSLHLTSNFNSEIMDTHIQRRLMNKMDAYFDVMTRSRTALRNKLSKLVENLESLVSDVNLHFGLPPSAMFMNFNVEDGEAPTKKATDVVLEEVKKQLGITDDDDAQSESGDGPKVPLLVRPTICTDTMKRHLLDHERHHTLQTTVDDVQNEAVSLDSTLQKLYSSYTTQSIKLLRFLDRSKTLASKLIEAYERAYLSPTGPGSLTDEQNIRGLIVALRNGLGPSWVPQLDFVQDPNFDFSLQSEQHAPPSPTAKTKIRGSSSSSLCKPTEQWPPRFKALTGADTNSNKDKRSKDSKPRKDPLFTIADKELDLQDEVLQTWTAHLMSLTQNILSAFSSFKYQSTGDFEDISTVIRQYERHQKVEALQKAKQDKEIMSADDATSSQQRFRKDLGDALGKLGASSHQGDFAPTKKTVKIVNERKLNIAEVILEMFELDLYHLQTVNDLVGETGATDTLSAKDIISAEKKGSTGSVIPGSGWVLPSDHWHKLRTEDEQKQQKTILSPIRSLWRVQGDKLVVPLALSTMMLHTLHTCLSDTIKALYTQEAPIQSTSIITLQTQGVREGRFIRHLNRMQVAVRARLNQHLAMIQKAREEYFLKQDDKRKDGLRLIERRSKNTVQKKRGLRLPDSWTALHSDDFHRELIIPPDFLSRTSYFTRDKTGTVNGLDRRGKFNTWPVANACASVAVLGPNSKMSNGLYAISSQLVLPKNRLWWVHSTIAGLRRLVFTLDDLLIKYRKELSSELNVRAEINPLKKANELARYQARRDTELDYLGEFGESPDTHLDPEARWSEDQALWATGVGKAVDDDSNEYMHGILKQSAEISGKGKKVQPGEQLKIMLAKLSKEEASEEKRAGRAKEKEEMEPVLASTIEVHDAHVDTHAGDDTMDLKIGDDSDLDSLEVSVPNSFLGAMQAYLVMADRIHSSLMTDDRLRIQTVTELGIKPLSKQGIVEGIRAELAFLEKLTEETDDNLGGPTGRRSNARISGVEETEDAVVPQIQFMLEPSQFATLVLLKSNLGEDLADLVDNTDEITDEMRQIAEDRVSKFIQGVLDAFDGDKEGAHEAAEARRDFWIGRGREKLSEDSRLADYGSVSNSDSDSPSDSGTDEIDETVTLGHKLQDLALSSSDDHRLDNLAPKIEKNRVRSTKKRLSQFRSQSPRQVVWIQNPEAQIRLNELCPLGRDLPTPEHLKKKSKEYEQDLLYVDVTKEDIDELYSVFLYDPTRDPTTTQNTAPGDLIPRALLVWNKSGQSWREATSELGAPVGLKEEHLSGLQVLREHSQFFKRHIMQLNKRGRTPVFQFDASKLYFRLAQHDNTKIQTRLDKAEWDGSSTFVFISNHALSAPSSVFPQEVMDSLPPHFLSRLSSLVPRVRENVVDLPVANDIQPFRLPPSHFRASHYKRIQNIVKMVTAPDHETTNFIIYNSVASTQKSRFMDSAHFLYQSQIFLLTSRIEMLLKDRREDWAPLVPFKANPDGLMTEGQMAKMFTDRARAAGGLYADSQKGYVPENPEKELNFLNFLMHNFAHYNAMSAQKLGRGQWIGGIILGYSQHWKNMVTNRKLFAELPEDRTQMLFEQNRFSSAGHLLVPGRWNWHEKVHGFRIGDPDQLVEDSAEDEEIGLVTTASAGMGEVTDAISKLVIRIGSLIADHLSVARSALDDVIHYGFRYLWFARLGSIWSSLQRRNALLHGAEKSLAEKCPKKVELFLKGIGGEFLESMNKLEQSFVMMYVISLMGGLGYHVDETWDDLVDDIQDEAVANSVAAALELDEQGRTMNLAQLVRKNALSGLHEEIDHIVDRALTDLKPNSSYDSPEFEEELVRIKTTKERAVMALRNVIAPSLLVNEFFSLLGEQGLGLKLKVNLGTVNVIDNYLTYDPSLSGDHMSDEHNVGKDEDSLDPQAVFSGDDEEPGLENMHHHPESSEMRREVSKVLAEAAATGETSKASSSQSRGASTPDKCTTTQVNAGADHAASESNFADIYHFRHDDLVLGTTNYLEDSLRRFEVSTFYLESVEQCRLLKQEFHETTAFNGAYPWRKTPLMQLLQLDFRRASASATACPIAKKSWPPVERTPALYTFLMYVTHIFVRVAAEGWSME